MLVGASERSRLEIRMTRMTRFWMRGWRCWISLNDVILPPFLQDILGKFLFLQITALMSLEDVQVFLDFAEIIDVVPQRVRVSLCHSGLLPPLLPSFPTRPKLWKFLGNSFQGSPAETI
jgi:hypothetical protein